MLPEDAEAELSWPHGAAQKAGTMEPPSALSTVLCIVLFIPTWEAGLTVLQSPAVLQASPCETVNLSCSFENRQGSVAKATWTIAPGVVLESDHPFYSGRLNVSFRDLLRKGEVTLTLSELEKRDSGLYQCQISIHQGESGTGAGTELQVTGRNESDTGKEPAPVGCCARELLYQVAIALGQILIIGLVATVLLKRC
ncbi:natural cytotoxicity triggering receptor 3-like [Chelonia mydas]|uniref:natural cytotoxicity triggering receptor 3-like n=1 Tax=Chelonia mydas TaxID=8469 RepID=UPI001CA907A3|nr:natural cytotoxicity triggering receptor 3-like [Chelonia mydas]